MGLSFLKQIFKGSRCGCSNKNKRSTRKRKSRKNYRGGHKYSKKSTLKKTTTIRLSRSKLRT